jgi:hypothetical protein
MSSILTFRKIRMPPCATLVNPAMPTTSTSACQESFHMLEALHSQLGSETGLASQAYTVPDAEAPSMPTGAFFAWHALSLTGKPQSGPLLFSSTPLIGLDCKVCTLACSTKPTFSARLSTV